MLRGKWPRRRGKKSRSSRHDSAACNSTPSAGRYGLFHLFYLFIFYLSSICKKNILRLRLDGERKARQRYAARKSATDFFLFLLLFLKMEFQFIFGKRKKKMSEVLGWKTERETSSAYCLDSQSARALLFASLLLCVFLVHCRWRQTRLR